MLFPIQILVKDDKGEAPRFVWPLTPMRVSDGEPTKLICTLTGKPIPAITWYQHGRELIPSKDFQPHFEGSTGTASLHITEVFPDDAGIYRCRAANKHGMAECEATLSVGKSNFVIHSNDLVQGSATFWYQLAKFQFLNPSWATLDY